MDPILACDPGYNFTGVAVLVPDSGFWDAAQYEDPLEAYEWLSEYRQHTSTVILEDYTHGGVFTKEAKETLRVVGYIDYSFQYDYGIQPKIVNKNRRLPWVTEAREMIVREYGGSGTEKEVKDAIAALAHALAERHFGQE